MQLFELPPAQCENIRYNSGGGAISRIHTVLHYIICVSSVAKVSPTYMHACIVSPSRLCLFCRLSTAMPFHVYVQMLSGEVLEFMMSRHSAVLDLKQRLCESLGVKAVEQVIVPRDRERCLDDAADLMDLVDWFVLGDVMSSKAITAMTFELTVTLVIKPKLCVYCDEPAAQKCARCRAARYCSHGCQRQHWRVHKLHCSRSMQCRC